jgi:hypothetical protein
LAFQSFDFERTWLRLFQTRVVHTKFDIYVLLHLATRRMPLTFLEHLSSPLYSVGFVLPSLWFCKSLFVLLSLFFWPLYCLFFFDVRLMITPLVSLDFSCIWFAILYCIFDSDSQSCVITFVLNILWGFFSLVPLFGQHTNLRSHYLGWVEIRLFNNISVISWWSVLFADEINNTIKTTYLSLVII